MEEKCLSKNERMSRFLTNCQKAIFWLFPFALLYVTTLTIENYYGSSDLLFIVILMIGCILRTLSHAYRKEVLSVSVIDIIVLSWILYSLLNAFVLVPIHNKDSLIPSATTFALYVTLRLTMPRTKTLGKVLAGGIAVIGLYECLLGLLQLYGIKQSNHAVFQITGTFFNPGPYSIYLVTAFSICLAYCLKRYKLYPFRTLIEESRFCKIIGRCIFMLCAFGCFVCVIAMPATLSRTAFASLAVVLIVMFGWRSRKMLMLIAVSTIALGFALYFLKKDSADGRLLMWIVSLRAICGHLWFGNGIGGFHKAFSDSQASFFAKNPDSSFALVAGSPEYAFNDFLEVGVEQGVIGMLFFSLIIILSIIRLLKKRDPIGFGLIALSVSAMFSYPFNLLPFRIIGCVFVAYAAALDKLSLLTVKGWLKIVLPIVACTVVLTFLFPVHSRIKAKVEAVKDFEIDRALRVQTVNDDHIERAKVLSDYPRYMFWLGKRLARSGRYYESLYVFLRGSEMSCDNIFYVMMGNDYRLLNKIDMAEQFYKTAHFMQPCKLYPMFQLLLMYESEGRLADARELASAIIATKSKVRSSATDEIKKYASAFLTGG